MGAYRKHLLNVGNLLAERSLFSFGAEAASGRRHTRHAMAGFS